MKGINMKSTFYQYSEPPEPPPDSSWPFEEELQKPIHSPIKFDAGKPKQHELDFRQGIRFAPDFPDPQGLLQTAYQDFRAFLKSINLNDTGPCPLIIEHARTSIFEEYRVVVQKDRIAILSADTEGIRRGLIHLEDMILSRGAYCLPIGVTARKPVIRTRISRCFYGPINRPPRCRDELTDDVNYYPDGYLNRLAHNGVNVLWLTITFEDTCPSKIIPEYGRDSARRLDKLRQTVQRCARYGIKIYPFCIEPAAFPANSPILKAHPELKGHTKGEWMSAFCTSSDMGRAYLEEATRTLFSLVPGLGGLIVIPVGERFTHCYSSSLPINCPRCSKKQPWEVLADTLAAMARGMHSVAPDAELVSWPYSQLFCWGKKLMINAAGHMPKNVILQHNFETGGKVKQLGKWRPLWDYWLSWVGPSKIFADCARAARKNKTRVFAKLQVGCSHEVATVPHIPAPGLIHNKYQKMHRLGVSGAMQGWYFGNYPSLMSKAAGMLSFAPFPKTENDFLLSLARRDWGRYAPKMVTAWQHFKKGYSQYPGANFFGYYGPMHDGVVWPLYLVPRHLPLSPTWVLAYPPSGDQIGECVTSVFTYEEMMRLCKAMRDSWLKGVAIVRKLEPVFKTNNDCLQDIYTARALGIQFDSGYNIFLFYYLRDKLAVGADARTGKAILKKMRAIVQAELRNDKELLDLCLKDPRLGFHSEAEGYKYFPEKIKWRIKQLKELLKHEFPLVERQVGRRSNNLFADYTGIGPAGNSYRCRRIENGPVLFNDPLGTSWQKLPLSRCSFWAAPDHADPKIYWGNAKPLCPVARQNTPPSRLSWRAAHDRKAIYLCLYLDNDQNTGTESGSPPNSADDSIVISVEPSRLRSRIMFHASANGIVQALIDDMCAASVRTGWKANMVRKGDNCAVSFIIPFHCLGINPFAGADGKRFRFNAHRWFAANSMYNSWAEIHRALCRLSFGYDHPENYGWLVLEDD